MRLRWLLLLMLVMSASCGCQSSRAKSQAIAPIAPKPYTRITHPDTNTLQLQIALRKFVPAHGKAPTIWLAGVMHVGESNYYQNLQQFLDKQTVVLFEGVNTDSHRQRVNDKPAPFKLKPKEDAATDAGFSMQSLMAASLGLVFQLEAIDYDRTNFLNSDLSIPQLQKLLTQSAASTNIQTSQANQPAASNPTFDALLEVMDGSSFLGELFKLGLQFIGSNPKMQAVAKLTLIEVVGQIKGDFSEMQGMPPDMKELIKVLIEARNQNVIADLKVETRRVPKSGSIAVFYGTGHMDDLEKRLRSELRYRPVDEKWLTVFEVNTQKSGILPGEVQMMRNLIQYQLNQMK